MGHHLEMVADEVFTDPTRSEYLRGKWESAVLNLTPVREVGLNFSEVLLQVSVENEAILAAPDLITHTVEADSDDGWRAVLEGEVHVSTDELGAVSREQLRVGRNTEICLPDAVETIPANPTEIDLKDPPTLTTNQHRAVREAALSYADYALNDGSVDIFSVDKPSTQLARDRIKNWLFIYKRQFEPDSDIDPSTESVNTVIEKIVP
jgi:hypothetical protein